MQGGVNSLVQELNTGVVGVKPAKHNHMHYNQKVRKNQGIAASERIEINSAANISEQDEKEFIDAETAPDFLEGDIAIPEVHKNINQNVI